MAGSVSRYRLTPPAVADLEEIWLYAAGNWSPEQADGYHADIVAALEALAAGTRTGRVVGVREGYLKYPLGAHFVFYRLSADSIDFIRVLHQRTDVHRHL